MIKWLLRLIVFTVAAVCLLLAALAWPSVWFSHTQRLGNITFHADFDFDGDWPAILADITSRYEHVPVYDSSHLPDVYLFSEQDNYNLFARLALVPDAVPGFNLSIFDNSYISLPGLELRRERPTDRYAYSSITGEIAQCVTHELIHGLLQERLGYAAVLSIPHWKAEGYCEYFAARPRLEADSVKLRDRIGQWLNVPKDSRTREYFLYGLMANYLFAQEQLTLESYLSNSLTFDEARNRMLTWYDTLPHDSTLTSSMP
ncbi:MAG TPA: hypothetical protein PLF13_03615 [candidate division Zixibacteria bacterium]|nr:hypothetical protein [candidate division Zixibacteria bacterium]